MALTEPKRRYIILLRELGRDLARAMSTAQDLHSVFFDREYDEATGVTDADLVEWDMTKADVSAFINCCEQLINLRDNAAVTQGDWGATINVVRDS